MTTFTLAALLFLTPSVESIRRVVSVGLPLPEDGRGEVVVVGGVPEVLCHQADPAPVSVASPALA